MTHRKLVKRYEAVRSLHELTFSCYDRRQLLTNETWRRMLSASITAALQRHRFGLTAFVFMPEHVHLLVLPEQSSSGVSDLLRAIKRPFSFRVKKRLEEEGSALLESLTVRQRPGVMSFRFWQEGSGYDRNLETSSTAQAAMTYIHLNPVRRNLCEAAADWKWSSARFYYDPSMPVENDLPLLTRLPPDFWD